MLELERHALSAALLRCVSHKMYQILKWLLTPRAVFYVIIILTIFLQGLFPPGQGATIGVDFMIKTVEIKGEKVKVNGGEKNSVISTCENVV